MGVHLHTQQNMVNVICALEKYFETFVISELLLFLQSLLIFLSLFSPNLHFLKSPSFWVFLILVRCVCTAQGVETWICWGLWWACDQLSISLRDLQPWVPFFLRLREHTWERGREWGGSWEENSVESDLRLRVHILWEAVCLAMLSQSSEQLQWQSSGCRDGLPEEKVPGRLDGGVHFFQIQDQEASSLCHNSDQPAHNTRFYLGGLKVPLSLMKPGPGFFLPEATDFTLP